MIGALDEMGRCEMNAIWIAILAVIVLVVVFKFSQGGVEGSSADVKAKIKQGAIILDVRTPGEYQSGHYPGAINIPLQSLCDRLADVGDKKKAVVVYCASGMRSAQAAKILSDAGFGDVSNAGGLRNLEP